MEFFRLGFYLDKKEFFADLKKGVTWTCLGFEKIASEIFQINY